MPHRSAAALDSLVARLEGRKSLDGLADQLAKPGSHLGQPVKDGLSGTPLGHPLHPVLVALPIGAWLTASALDALGRKSDRNAAQRAVGLGILAALPTAASGYSDWVDTSGGERRVGVVHALLNYGAVGIYSASWIARRAGRHRLGVVLSGAGAATLTVSGWLGGHLAYATGVGVDTTAFQHQPQEWVDAGPAEGLTEQVPTQRTANGLPLFVVRVRGQILVLADRCTHRGAPLSEGELTDGCITCPWHGSKFDVVTGAVVRGPATRPQPVYQSREIDGRLQIRRIDEHRSLRTEPVG